MNIELMRLLENIVRIGVVTEINTDTWEVRVQTGGLTTNWIRWNSGRAGKFKIWIPHHRANRCFSYARAAIRKPQSAQEVCTATTTRHRDRWKTKWSLPRRTVRNFAITHRKAA